MGEALATGITSMLVSVLVSIVAYVISSLSLHTVAKRRGIKKPWLSWLPIGRNWILGSISDQYRYVARGEVKSKRKVLLTLEIITYCIMVIVLICCGVIFAKAFNVGMNYVDPDEALMELMGPLIAMCLLLLPMIGVAIAMAVVALMAQFDWFESALPGKGTLLLLACIFAGVINGTVSSNAQNLVIVMGTSCVLSLVAPVIFFVIRKKDDGMPPRRPNPAAYMPGYIPQQPYQPQQPVYQPQQPVYPQQPIYQPQPPVEQPPQQSVELPQEPVQEVDPWNRPEGE
jgi:hypothetical protein